MHKSLKKRRKKSCKQALHEGILTKTFEEVEDLFGVKLNKSKIDERRPRDGVGYFRFNPEREVSPERGPSLQCSSFAGELGLGETKRSSVRDHFARAESSNRSRTDFANLVRRLLGPRLES